MPTKTTGSMTTGDHLRALMPAGRTRGHGKVTTCLRLNAA